MTVSLLFELIAAGHLVLACVCAHRLHDSGNRLLIIPLLLCLTLLYDNAVIGAGRFLGAGGVLEALSVPRFAIHAVLTPLLIPWAHAVAIRAGVSWAGSRPARLTTAALTALAIGTAVGNDVVRLSLRPEWWAGTLRYGNAAASGTEALPVLIAGTFVLVTGVAIWLRRGYRPLLATAAVMTVAASLAGAAPLLGNLGELILCAGLAATAHRLRHAPNTAAVPAAQRARVTRRLGWIAFPLLLLTVAVPALPTIGGFDSGTVAQAVYQILLVMHAQLGITTYGLPPKGNRLRRFHTAFGYANLPLLLAAQLLALFAATAAAADLLAGLLLLTITVHVGLGLVFALRRGRVRTGIRPGPPATVRGTTAAPSSR